MEIKKITSISIYLAIVLWAIATLENKEIFAVVIGYIIPVLMIWFPEEVNDLTLGTGGVDGPVIDSPTPAFMISGVGWLVLLGLPLTLLFS